MNSNRETVALTTEAIRVRIIRIGIACFFLNQYLPQHSTFRCDRRIYNSLTLNDNHLSYDAIPFGAFIRIYYPTHCNTAQIWSWCTEYSSSLVNRHPAIYSVSCVAGKNGKIKIVSSFSTIKLCFVMNVLNNKTIILLNLAESRLSQRPRRRTGDIPRDFSG